MTQAWWTAAIPMMRRPPKLADLVPPKAVAKPKTSAQIEAIVRHWHAAINTR